jgi:signal transduction histidine kinase
MASELQQLVALRQNLATAEERNRLARELHDTVKQQVFATTMQVGAARVLVDRDPALAQARLTEAERLAHGAQRELTAILEQLRPGSYSRPHSSANSFEVALQSYVSDWSRQNDIVVHAHGNRCLLCRKQPDKLCSALCRKLYPTSPATVEPAKFTSRRQQSTSRRTRSP